MRKQVEEVISHEQHEELIALGWRIVREDVLRTSWGVTIDGLEKERDALAKRLELEQAGRKVADEKVERLRERFSKEQDRAYAIQEDLEDLFAIASRVIHARG